VGLSTVYLFSLSFTFFSLLVITQFIKGGYNIAIVKEERILPDSMPIGFGSEQTAENNAVHIKGACGIRQQPLSARSA